MKDPFLEWTKRKNPELKIPSKCLHDFVEQFITCTDKKNGKKCEGCEMDTDFIIQAVAMEIFEDKEYKKLAKADKKQAKKLQDKWV